MSRNRSKLQMSHITKQFPGVRALDDVSFEAQCGEIVALVGVNGAGKSTLMNVLGGIYQPDDGDIFIDGNTVVFHSPKDAEKNGIAFIHQELLYFESLTVAENIFISHLFKNKILPFFVSKHSANEATKKYLNMLGSQISPTIRMEDISVGERQEVEIARALALGSEIVIFDEPTSSLSLKEKEMLFKVIGKLKNEGKAIIYITHFLDEVMEICDKYVVLRNGKIHGKGEIKDITRNEIIRMIIGKDIRYEEKIERTISEKPILKIENIKSGNLLNNISFHLNHGEILGLWGLMGSGRTELIRAILGLDRIDGGKIYILDNGTMKKISQRQLLKYCGYITENRHADGLFLTESLWKNVSVTSLSDYASKVFNFLDMKQEIDVSKKYVDLLKIATPSHLTKVENLSGGNQQKIVFSKWLNKKPKILIMDEPSRGVDVGAKLEINNLIKKLAEQGTATLLITSEIEEMVGLSDRALVLREGSIVADLKGKDINNAMLMQMSLGVGEIHADG
jgi:ABC-type sugar transport system ATPase subunit